jgi:hypothetical protein
VELISRDDLVNGARLTEVNRMVISMAGLASLLIGA